MSALDTGAAVAAAFYLGQVATVVGLLWPAREEQAAESALIHGIGARASHPLGAVAVDDRTWLIGAVLAAACSSLGDLLLHLGVHRLHHALAPLTDAPLLLVGPALWLYIRAITRRMSEPPPSWRDFGLHALPAMLAFVLLTWDALTVPVSATLTFPERSMDEVIAMAPVAAHLLIYLVLILHRIRKVQSQLLHEMSDLTDRRLRWLSAAAWLLVCVVVIWMLSWSWPVAVSNQVTNVLMAGWLTTIGLFGVRQPNVFSSRPARTSAVHHTLRGGTAPSTATAEDASDISIAPPVPDPSTPSSREAGNAKYTKASMTPEHIAMLAARLNEVMRRDKPFLESDLNLSSLAQAIGATPHQLSQVLSVAIGQSFYDYVNTWRVAAVRTALMRPGAAVRPMLEIALECGFGSKSAFNEVFKRVTGMTPSAYRMGLTTTAAAAGPVQTRGERRQSD